MHATLFFLLLYLSVCAAVLLSDSLRKGESHMDALLFFPPLPPSTLLSNSLPPDTGCETQTHTHCDRRSLGAEWGNRAAAPLAGLIKPAHLCLIPHLEQVAASPAEPSPPFSPSHLRHLVTAPPDNDDRKGALRPSSLSVILLSLLSL